VAFEHVEVGGAGGGDGEGGRGGEGGGGRPEDVVVVGEVGEQDPQEEADCWSGRRASVSNAVRLWVSWTREASTTHACSRRTEKDSRPMMRNVAKGLLLFAIFCALAVCIMKVGDCTWE